MRGGEGDAGQLALEVVGVLLAVAGMVQQAIDVAEDVPPALVPQGPHWERTNQSSLDISISTSACHCREDLPSPHGI